MAWYTPNEKMIPHVMNIVMKPAATTMTWRLNQLANEIQVNSFFIRVIVQRCCHKAWRACSVDETYKAEGVGSEFSCDSFCAGVCIADSVVVFASSPIMMASPVTHMRYKEEEKKKNKPFHGPVILILSVLLGQDHGKDGIAAIRADLINSVGPLTSPELGRMRLVPHGGLPFWVILTWGIFSAFSVFLFVLVLCGVGSSSWGRVC